MLISTAFAQQAAGQAASTSGIFVQMLPFLILFVVMYFLMIRPQQKRQKEMREMLSKLGQGDEVVLSGGFYAKIVSVSDDRVVVNLAGPSDQPMLVTVRKDSVQLVLPKGSVDVVSQDK
jgi:preprotein translocase subunit YajC